MRLDRCRCIKLHQDVWLQAPEALSWVQAAWLGLGEGGMDPRCGTQSGIAPTFSRLHVAFLQLVPRTRRRRAQSAEFSGGSQGSPHFCLSILPISLGGRIMPLPHVQGGRSLALLPCQAPMSSCGKPGNHGGPARRSSSPLHGYVSITSRNGAWLVPKLNVWDRLGSRHQG